MKNCTKHSIQRWVERILEIKTVKERDEYIRDNIEQVKEHMNKTIEFAEFIYKGQIGDNTTKNYFIQNDIVFVTNTNNDAIITVYKVDFNFTKELNLSVAKGLLEEIRKLLGQQEEIEIQILEEVEANINKSKQLEFQIEMITQQLQTLKKDKDFVDATIGNVKSKSNFVELEIKKYTGMLVNSKEYREDLKLM